MSFSLITEYHGAQQRRPQSQNKTTNILIFNLISNKLGFYNIYSHLYGTAIEHCFFLLFIKLNLF